MFLRPRRFSLRALTHGYGLFLGLIAALSLSLLIEGRVGARASDSIERAPDLKLQAVLSLLETSATGRALLQKAMHAWRVRTKAELESHLKWGASSRTDAVLIRHYDSDTGQESRERQVSIYLRKSQSLADVMLDLAHELVHATSTPGWDPYDPGLTAAGYIRATIEGEGGEVEAVRVECQVSREVYGESSQSEAASRCRRYWTAKAINAQELIRKDFYRVGHWISDLKNRLGPEAQAFPLLSDEKPALYSSTGGTPYPVALYEEYRQMTAVACENTRRRAPASDAASAESGTSGLDESARLFIQRRCKN